MTSVKSATATARRAISVYPDRVIKVQEPEASRRERLRTLAGRDVAQETGLFVVPEILSFDDNEGEIVFQRLPLTVLRQVLSRGTQSMELVERAGRVLAAIHSHQRSLGEPAAVIRIGGVESASAPVPLHGDFGMRNLFYLAESDDIAVIDWSNAEWLEMDGDVGAPEIDVAVFLISFFHRRLFTPWPIARRHEVARHFLATYTSVSPRGIDLIALRGIVAFMTPRFARMTRQRRGPLHALGSRHALIDLSFFLRRLSHTG